MNYNSTKYWLSSLGLGPFICVAVAVLYSPQRACSQIAFGQVDTFQSGSTSGWQQGTSSPNPPTVVTSGGPSGGADAYLKTVSTGVGAGGKMIMFNTAQWLGDYNAVGVTKITADMANFGSTPLHMRIAFQGGPSSSRYASTNEQLLPANGVWRPVTFDLIPSELTLISGTDSVAAALRIVSELRILSSTTPLYNGDSVVAVLGTDNIRATSVPVPEPSMLPIGLLSIAAVTISSGRTRNRIKNIVIARCFAE